VRHRNAVRLLARQLAFKEWENAQRSLRSPPTSRSIKLGSRLRLRSLSLCRRVLRIGGSLAAIRC
jgi:hypothetical protein